MSSWFEAAAAASISFVQEQAARVQLTIEKEKNEFLAEYSSFRSAAPSTEASQPTSSRMDRNADDQLLGVPLEEIRRVGTALFNPFEDQASFGICS